MFVGGDKRQIEIIKDFYNKNYEIDLIGYDNYDAPEGITKREADRLDKKDYHAIIMPVNGVAEDGSITSSFCNRQIKLKETFFVTTKKDILIFTGIRTRYLDKMLSVSKRKVIELMADPDIKKDNSIPTVEGIIGHLVFNTDSTINGSKILILGYGNVGKMLAEKLYYLGANITVGVLLEEDYDYLEDRNVDVFYTEDKPIMREAMANNSIIINTVPELLIDKECLEVAQTGAYILDISSHPHGVDFKSANDLKIKNKLLLGIPGEVSPRTAGIILTKKINSILEGD